MEKKKMLVCGECDSDRHHEDDLKCFKNEMAPELKIYPDVEKSEKAEMSVPEKVAHAGRNVLYHYLRSIQNKQICKGWAVGKGYVYENQLYIDEYVMHYDQFDEFQCAVSSLTVYPFLVEVEASTVSDPNKRNLYIDAALNSDIYSLIYYNEKNNTCRPCGWISPYEIAHGSFERLSGPKRELIMIPQSELCPSFYALLHHPPGEYRWQCKTSKAHQLVGSLLHTANQVSNRQFLGETSYSLIRTDYWAKEDFFEAVNNLHKKLHFLGYDDDDIIRKTVSEEDQKLAVKALIREIAKKRGQEQIYDDLVVNIY